MPSAYKNNTNKNEINVIFLLTLCAFSGKLYPVSERKNNMKNEIEMKRAEQVARGCQPTWGMTLPEYYAYQEKRREAHFAKGEAERDRRFAIALKKMKNSAWLLA